MISNALSHVRTKLVDFIVTTMISGLHFVFFVVPLTHSLTFKISA